TPPRVSNEGFTLIELVVVVALIGLLAEISITSYARFQEKARSAEAKLALSALYTSETAYSAESLSFTTCVDNIGFRPDSAIRYFRVGFSAAQAGSNTCGPTG